MIAIDVTDSMNTIGVRAATSIDSENIFNWRNDTTTRQMSLDTHEVQWSEHHEWYHSTLSKPNSTLLIGFLKTCNSSIGVVRFEKASDSALVSINLAPDMRGRKLALPLLKTAIYHYKHETNTALILQAQIRQNNLASRRIFTQAGFSLEQEEDSICHFTLAMQQVGHRTNPNKD